MLNIQIAQRRIGLFARSLIQQNRNQTLRSFASTSRIAAAMGKDTIKLASGKEMPMVGFGCWKVPNDIASDTVYNVRFRISHNSTSTQLRELTEASIRPSKLATVSSMAPMTMAMRRNAARA